MGLPRVLLHPYLVYFPAAFASSKDVAKLYEAASQRVDELQAEVEAEEREPGEAMPVRHRGKGQSPAE
eukprot:6608449-Pyramimonas_sp.AAC.1